jgi:hypothetical protein
MATTSPAGVTTENSTFTTVVSVVALIAIVALIYFIARGRGASTGISETAPPADRPTQGEMPRAP